MENFPIDRERVYLGGFSGGSRYSFYTARKNDVTGIIACGAGASCHAHGDRVPESKVVTYGLCGTNCFNRYDMAESHAKMKNRDSVLRYFIGNHAWAGGDLLEDAMIHLNGVFLEKNGDDYPQQQARFEMDVLKVIDACKENAPHRAYMLTDFMVERGLTTGSRATQFTRLHRKLGAEEVNVDYVKGLEEMDEMAKKVCGKEGMFYKNEFPEVKAAGEKYPHTPLGAIFLKFKEHVVQP